MTVAFLGRMFCRDEKVTLFSMKDRNVTSLYLASDASELDGAFIDILAPEVLNSRLLLSKKSFSSTFQMVESTGS